MLPSLHVPDFGYVQPMVLPTGFLTREQTPRIAAGLITLASAVFLWRPWLTAGAVEERRTETVFWFAPAGVAVLVLTVGTAVLILLSSHTDRSMSAPIVAMSVGALLPGVLVIVVVEFAQSLIPTWLTPVLTNSELLTLRADYGVWSHTGLLVAGVMIWAVSGSMTSGGDLVSSRRAAGRLALLLTIVALPVIRALPLFTVTASSENLGNGDRNLAMVEIVPGEVPILGIASTVAIFGFIVLGLLAFISPHRLTLIAVSVALGSHLAIIWLQITVTQIADAILPESWSGLVGDWLAVNVTTLHTSTLTLFVSFAGFVAVLFIASGHTEVSGRSDLTELQPTGPVAPRPIPNIHSDLEGLP